MPVPTTANPFGGDDVTEEQLQRIRDALGQSQPVPQAPPAAAQNALQAMPPTSNPYGNMQLYNQAQAANAPVGPPPVTPSVASGAVGGLGNKLSAPGTPIQDLSFSKQMTAPIPQGMAGAGQNLQQLYAGANKTGQFDDIQDVFKQMDAAKAQQAGPAKLQPGMSLAPGMGSYSPEQLDQQIRSMNTGADDRLKASFDQGKKETGEGGVRDLQHYIDQMNPGIVTPETRAQAINAQGKASDMAAAQRLAAEKTASEVEKQKLHNQGQLDVEKMKTDLFNKQQEKGDEKDINKHAAAAGQALANKMRDEMKNSPGKYSPQAIDVAVRAEEDRVRKALSPDVRKTGEDVKPPPNPIQAQDQAIQDINNAMANGKLDAPSYLKSVESSASHHGPGYYKHALEQMQTHPAGQENTMAQLLGQMGSDLVAGKQFHQGTHNGYKLYPKLGKGSPSELGVQTRFTTPYGYDVAPSNLPSLTHLSMNGPDANAMHRFSIADNILRGGQ